MSGTFSFPPCRRALLGFGCGCAAGRGASFWEVCPQRATLLSPPALAHFPPLLALMEGVPSLLPEHLSRAFFFFFFLPFFNFLSSLPPPWALTESRASCLSRLPVCFFYFIFIFSFPSPSSLGTLRSPEPPVPLFESVPPPCFPPLPFFFFSFLLDRCGALVLSTGPGLSRTRRGTSIHGECGCSSRSACGAPCLSSPTFVGVWKAGTAVSGPELATRPVPAVGVMRRGRCFLTVPLAGVFFHCVAWSAPRKRGGHLASAARPPDGCVCDFALAPRWCSWSAPGWSLRCPRLSPRRRFPSPRCPLSVCVCGGVSRLGACAFAFVAEAFLPGSRAKNPRGGGSRR